MAELLGCRRQSFLSPRQGSSRSNVSTAAACIVAFLLAVTGVSAQQTVAPKELFRDTVALDTPWLALLRDATDNGSQEKLLSVITEFLSDLSKTPAGVRSGTLCCDPGAHIYDVTFLASEAADAPLVRVFAYKAGLSRGRLPGIAGASEPVIEVFVAEDLSVALRSVYESEPIENPLDEQSGAFVKLVLSKLALPGSSDFTRTRALAAMDRLSHEARNQLIASKPPLAVTLSRVDLPVKRAKIAIQHTITVSDPTAHLREQTRWIDDTIRRAAVMNAVAERRHPQDASCAAISAAIQAAVATVSGRGECSPLAADPSKCFAAVKEAMGSAYRTSAAQNPACDPGAAYTMVRRFVSTVPSPSSGAVSTGTTVVMNAPNTYWSFGLSTGFITRLAIDDQKPRVQISNGRIAVNPFDRVLAMGTVSYVPYGYDPDTVEMSGMERLRLFGGIAFAPYFGPTGGIGWAFNRYLGANVGYAYLVYDTPKSGESIDVEPTVGNRAAPFRLAGAHALFAGLTYNVK